MLITKDAMVSLEYSLADTNGNLIDKSEKGEAFEYIHGHEMTLEGIEEILEGKEAGFTYEGVIPCDKAYGKRDQMFFIPVPKEEFEDVDKFEVGMKLTIVNNYDEEQEMEILEIDDENVTIDANSPYADMDIKFSCKVIDVRKATQEEIDEIEEEHSCGCGSDCDCDSDCGCDDH